MDLSDQVLTAIIAVFSAITVTFIGGMFARPKVSAEAKASSAGGEVAYSADARAWAETFQKQAEQANVRATSAEDKARRAEERCDGMERKMDDLVTYTLACQGEI